LPKPISKITHPQGVETGYRKMENISEILKNLPKIEPLSSDDYESRRIEWANSRKGNLEGYECSDCLNRGYKTELVNGVATARDCKCLNIRRSLRNIEKSGLKPIMDEYTFDRYLVKAPWQDNIKQKAIAFAKDSTGKWFGVLGQTGSGKTHICTAIAVSLLNGGKETYYMLWSSDIKKLRATVNEGETHEKEVRRLQSVSVLYIDDLFKCKKGSEPSDADVRLAFEILNARYNAKLVTLISSEHTIDELSKIDGAIAGRINQMGGLYIINIAHDATRDYRWTPAQLSL